MNCEPQLPSISEVVLRPATKPKGDSGDQPSTRPPSSSSSKPTQSPPPFTADEEERDEIVNIENVTVKFRLTGNQVIAQVYPNCMTLGEVKTDIGRRFEVPSELLMLIQGQHVLSDDCRIRETDHDDFGIHEYGLELKELRRTVKSRKPLDGSDESEEVGRFKLDLDVYYK